MTSSGSPNAATSVLSRACIRRCTPFGERRCVLAVRAVERAHQVERVVALLRAAGRRPQWLGERPSPSSVISRQPSPCSSCSGASDSSSRLLRRLRPHSHVERDWSKIDTNFAKTANSRLGDFLKPAIRDHFKTGQRSGSRTRVSIPRRQCILQIIFASERRVSV